MGLFSEQTILLLFCCCNSYLSYGLIPGLPFKCKCGINNFGDKHAINTETYEFSWQVSLIDDSGISFCSGSLLNDYYIITAAHCVISHHPQKLNILFSAPYSTIIRVDRIFIHPEFKNIGAINDIALVKLRRRIQFSNKIMPPCLVRPGEDFEGQTAVMSRQHNFKREIWDAKLQNLDLLIISQRNCRKAYGNNVILASMLCTLGSRRNKNEYQGDTGGPLMLEKNQRWYLIGVISWAHSHTGLAIYAVYTRIDHYYNWINSITTDAKTCTN